MTNTLAYYENLLIMDVKSFITLGPGVHVEAEAHVEHVVNGIDKLYRVSNVSENPPKFEFLDMQVLDTSGNTIDQLS